MTDPDKKYTIPEKIKQRRIAVLAGGDSSEREISLKTGGAVIKALQDLGLDAVFVDVSDVDLFSGRDPDFDLAFIALHGRFGEDGTIQEIFSRKNVPFTGSGPEASRLAMDKLLSKESFVNKGISVPDYALAGQGDEAFKFGYPCVVKPRHEGSSIGLTVVSRPDQAPRAVDDAARYDDEILVEKYIAGREITVGILEDKPLPVVEIVPAEGVYDFNAKYRDAGTKYIAPAALDDDVYRKVQDTGVAAHYALGCKGFSRVDMRLSSDGEPFVLEVNTIPGLTERSLLPLAARADGIDFKELCLRILISAL